MIGLLVAETTAIVYLTHRMKDRPYSAHNMASSYYLGCLMGARPITQIEVDKCTQIATTYERALSALANQ
jgi:hypothetical protein